MIETDRQAFGEAMLYLVNCYARPVPDGLVAAYWECLRGVSLRAAKIAIREAAQSRSSYLPTAGQLLEVAKLRQKELDDVAARSRMLPLPRQPDPEPRTEKGRAIMQEVARTPVLSKEQGLQLLRRVVEMVG